MRNSRLLDRQAVIAHAGHRRLPTATPRRMLHPAMEIPMGRSILLLFLGVPIPIIILLALFWH